MGLFDAVLGGKTGADHMCQALFNVVAFLPYCSRANYQDFNDFWHAKVPTESGAEERLNQVFYNYSAHFKKDESLYAEVDYRKEINSNGAKGWGYTGGVRWMF